ncbi:rve domain-containing protein/RVT_3 domain-containing protein [Gossypium australe]|uniref:Rve domain-containing protein/RVT_3 domain-containing protein n=1 Tax=Gossypium australe TaxID=47621 RepID=A0A5B6VWD4_9ROSI|nr:rve domain-containing protein/RVT_3 domain-containing protein [Gossypium australe]
MWEINEGICGDHLGVRQGYYWLTVQKDAHVGFLPEICSGTMVANRASTDHVESLAWIEAKALATTIERQMESFLWKSIGKFKNFQKDLQIAVAQSSVKTPQTNDQVETMNKKILIS